MSADLVRLHINALKSAFEFARASSLSWDQGAADAHENQVGIVLACISRGVRCGVESDQLLKHFLTSEWPSRGQIDRMWKAYAAAGYIDTTLVLCAHLPNTPVTPPSKVGDVRILPLEMAAVLGNKRAFQGLLDCGADIHKIPSQMWASGKKAMTPLGFLKFAVRNESTRRTMTTMAAKSMGANPLELAVFKRDIDEFSSLLAAGQDIMQVPSRQWDTVARKKVDTTGFIQALIKEPTLCEQFTALATNAILNAHIDRGSLHATVPPAVSMGARKAASRVDPTTHAGFPRGHKGMAVPSSILPAGQVGAGEAGSPVPHSTPRSRRGQI